MGNLKHIKIFSLLLICTLFFTSSDILIDKVSATTNKTAQEQTNTNYIQIKPLTLVANPQLYLNKNIEFIAKFDKFSTLGLDYKSAFKSSEDYISFLIKREDTKYNIPLSELKLFLKRDYAEKFIDLKLNDEIKVRGFVFSNALGDPWVEVKTLIITKKAPEINNDGAK